MTLILQEPLVRLKKHQDAIEIDTSKVTIEEQVNLILNVGKKDSRN